ncbi:MAG: hypothetical protein V4617_13720 [Gemmatimonadota bacterium]
MLLSIGASAGAGAQSLASTPPATCTAPSKAPLTVLTDMSLITGVVVRFTSNVNAKATDAHLAKALSVRSAEHLQALVEAPVRSRFDPSQSQGNDAQSAVAEGRVLGVRWVVTGRAERSKDSVRVSWTVLDSRTGEVRGSGTASDALVRLDALATGLAFTIGKRIGYQGPALKRMVPVSRSVSAMEQYLAGVFEYDSFDPEALRRSVASLKGATQAEPGMRPAWSALAVTLTRLVEWGEGASARGRSDRSREALTAANRALALAPRDPQSLATLAHIHVLRDEPVPAKQALDALRRAAPVSEDIPWLSAELSLLRGGDLGMSIDRRELLNSRNAHALFTRADGERMRGRTVQACQALNRLIVLEPAWAPAYVERALIRTSLGDRRGGWQDAEMATRLGQPSWGELVSAIIDFSVSDSLRTRERLRRLGPISDDTVLPWFDVLLRGAVYSATGQAERAAQVLSLAPCDDPRRRRLLRDPLLRRIKVPTACRNSVGSTNPTKDLAN